MLFLNKLLPVFVLPIGLVVILVVLGVLKKWRWLPIVAMIGLLLASVPVVANALLGRLEAVHAPIRVADAPQVDAVLVLGGVMSPSKGQGFVTEWSEGVERFEAGVALVESDRARLLLFTGDPRGSEGTGLQRAARARHVSPDRIAVIGAADNTADEAEQFRRYATEHGLKRVLLVTSAWHMPRSMRLFRSTGVEMIAFPVDFRTMPNRSLPYMDYLPTAGALEKTELALRETYGIAYYAVFGK